MITREETFQEYYEFLDSLVVEELIKEFNFKDGTLTYVGKKDFGGSQLHTYYFKDIFGIIWERDVPYRQFMEIANRSPKCRARQVL